MRFSSHYRAPRIFSARLMDWVDKSISFSFSAHLFLPPFFPSASVSFSYSFSRAFPPASSLGREENATTRKPRAFRYAPVRSIGRPCVRVWAQISMRPYIRCTYSVIWRTQCARNEVVSPLVISETFLPARKEP